MVAAERAKLEQMSPCLDAFGDDLHVQTLGKPDNALHDRCGIAVNCNVFDEPAVDLQVLDPQPLQVG